MDFSLILVSGIKIPSECRCNRHHHRHRFGKFKATRAFTYMAVLERNLYCFLAARHTRTSRNQFYRGRSFSANDITGDAYFARRDKTELYFISRMDNLPSWIRKERTIRAQTRWYRQKEWQFIAIADLICDIYASFSSKNKNGWKNIERGGCVRVWWLYLENSIPIHILVYPDATQ